MKGAIAYFTVSVMFILLIMFGGFLGYDLHGAMNEFNEARITKLEESKAENKFRITKLEQYKTSTEPIISGLNDEILELRDITDEFRAQIKGLQKEIFIGVQEGGM